MRLATAVLILACWAGVADAASKPPPPSAGDANRPPQNETTGSQSQAAPDLRGTPDAPVVVKVLPATKSPEEAAEEREVREDKAAADWWLVRLTGVLGLIGLLQLIAFALQARRLKQSVVAVQQIAETQADDMHAYIAEAARAATAMEGVGVSMAANVDNMSALMDMQKKFWSRQMRAYLSVVSHNFTHQDRARGLKFEAQLWLINRGNTPAHDVHVISKTEARDYPPDPNASYEIPPLGEVSYSVLVPGQQLLITAACDREFTNEEIVELHQGKTRRLYVYGTIWYRDGDKVDRHTNFCQTIVWNPLGNPFGLNTKAHNDAT